MYAKARQGKIASELDKKAICRQTSVKYFGNKIRFANKVAKTRPSLCRRAKQWVQAAKNCGTYMKLPICFGISWDKLRI